MIQPTGDKVLVKLIFEEQKSASGLILTNSNDYNAQKAVVVEVGAKVKEYIYEGDTVILGKYSGVELTFDGELYLIVAEKDILAVWETP